MGPPSLPDENYGGYLNGKFDYRILGRTQKIIWHGVECLEFLPLVNYPNKRFIDVFCNVAVFEDGVYSFRRSFKEPDQVDDTLIYYGYALRKISDEVTFDHYLEAAFMQQGLSITKPDKIVFDKEMARVRNIIRQFEQDVTFYDREKIEKSKNVFSVGPTGGPIETAFHCEALEDGIVELGIHIADVDHFVPHSKTCQINSKNVEFVARTLGEATFLPDRILSIFPEAVRDAASLAPGMDKVALSIITKIAPDGSLVDFNIKLALISSSGHYSNFDQTHNGMDALRQVAAKLQDGKCSGSETSLEKITEPVMILANSCAALFLNKHYKYGQLMQKVPFIPLVTKLKPLTTNYVVKNVNEKIKLDYAGVTAPISRYADFYVHRQIHAALGGSTTSVYDAKKVASISDARYLAGQRCISAINMLYQAKELGTGNSKVLSGKIMSDGIVDIPSDNMQFQLDDKWARTDDNENVSILVSCTKKYELEVSQEKDSGLAMPTENNAR